MALASQPTAIAELLRRFLEGAERHGSADRPNPSLRNRGTRSTFAGWRSRARTSA